MRSAFSRMSKLGKCLSPHAHHEGTKIISRIPGESRDPLSNHSIADGWVSAFAGMTISFFSVPSVSPWFSPSRAAQLAADDLAGGGQRQFVDEHDLTRCL